MYEYEIVLIPRFKRGKITRLVGFHDAMEVLMMCESIIFNVGIVKEVIATHKSGDKFYIHNFRNWERALG